MTKTNAVIALAVLLFAVAAGAESGSVLVLPGDTLWKVSSRELGDGRRWTEIAALNNLAKPYVIEEGMMLLLPGERPTAETSSSARVIPVPTGETPPPAEASPEIPPVPSPAMAVVDISSIVDEAPAPGFAWASSLRPQEGPAVDLPSLTMPAAVAFALAHAPEVRVAAANIERLKGMEGTALSAAFPQVNVGLDMKRYETMRTNTGGQLDAVGRSATLSISQSIYSFGRLSHALKAARAEEAAMRAALEEAKLQVRLRVESAFLGVLLARERLSVARESLEVAEALRNRARIREAAGVGTRFDVTRAVAEAAAAQARLVAAQAEIATTSEELAVAMGLPAGTRVDAVGEILAGIENLRPMAAAEAESVALSERPDLLVLEHRLRSYEEQTAYERAKGNPSLEAVAVAGYTHYDYIANAALYKGSENATGYAGVAMTVPVFDGFRVRESVRTQRAATDVLRAQYDRAKLDAIRDVRRIYLGLGAALEALAARKAGVIAARDAVRMAQVSFEAGRATSLDVIQAALTLADARRAEAETAYQFQAGLSQLIKATGTDEVLSGGVER